MSAIEELSGDERRALMERRLDELDRVLLGLLPRAERLALVASVESRIQEQGEAVELGRALPAESPITAVAVSSSRASARGRRSRLALSAGVLGIVAVSCLVVSPLLLLFLELFGDLLGETFAIVLLGLLVALVTCGGGIAVVGGGVALLRLARRGQTSTGTGWAITGLCTGALPLLIGFVGLLSLGATLLSTQNVEVTWNATPGGQPPTLMSAPADQPAPMPVAVPYPGYATAPPPVKWVDWDGKPTQLSAEPLPAAPPKEPAANPQQKAEPTPEDYLQPSTPAEKPRAEPTESED